LLEDVDVPIGRAYDIGNMLSRFAFGLETDEQPLALDASLLYLEKRVFFGKILGVNFIDLA
jgi:hypothetical protein